MLFEARRWLGSCVLSCVVLQVHSEEARQESLERLSGWLDIVETHLVREIAARTGELQQCSVCMVEIASRQPMHTATMAAP